MHVHILDCVYIMYVSIHGVYVCINMCVGGG